MTETHYIVDRLNPVIFKIYGDVGIRYYGLAYILAFIIGTALLYIFYKARKSPFDLGALQIIIPALLLGVMLGGRLGYVILYAFPEFIKDPLMAFRVWDGGMSSHGGFIGVTLALLWISHRFKVPLLQVGDLICPVVPVGLFFGRIANFINGELWGKVTTVSWAVIFPNSAPYGTPIEQIAPRHPSQLYEAFLEGLVLLLYSQWRFWQGSAQKTPGRLTGEFLIIYAIVRIICEQFREPDAGLIWGLSRGIFYSFFMILAGVLLVFYTIYKKSCWDINTESKA